MQLNVLTKGTYVHVKDDMFEIRVKKEKDYEKFHYSSRKVNSIVLSQGIALSTDAVKLAVKNNIDIIFIENDGFPIGRVWHSKFGSTTKIRKRQLEASLNEVGMNRIKEWISIKLQNQVDFINDLRRYRADKAGYIDEKVNAINTLLGSVKELNGNCTNDISDFIRGYEGTAGRHYFELLSFLLADEYKFDGRSFRPAKDAFNSFLNYAYGILYSRVEKILIIAGIDPYVGFLHRDDYNQLSMVFDFIEQYRIYADKVVFKLFSSKTVNQTHTDIITNGYSLNKNGKVLLVESYNKFMQEETIHYKGKNQTRNNAMQFDAHSFANSLIEK